MSSIDNWKIKQKDKTLLKKFSIFMNKFAVKTREAQKNRITQLYNSSKYLQKSNMSEE